MIRPESDGWIGGLRQCGITEVYYLVPIGNLESILHKGILSKSEVSAMSLEIQDFSERTVQERRMSFGFQDYVPFYFTKKTPMAYVQSRRGQTPYQCLLVVDVGKIVQQAEMLFFTNGNAASRDTSHFDDPQKLPSELPLDVLRADYWTGFPDGKRKRSAELLVYPKVFPDAIKTILLPDLNNFEDVKALIKRIKRKKSKSDSPSVPKLRLSSESFF